MEHETCWLYGEVESTMNCEDFFGNVLCFSQDFKGKIDIKKGGKKEPWLANICLLSGFHTCNTFFGMIYLRKAPEDWFFLGMGFW